MAYTVHAHARISRAEWDMTIGLDKYGLLMQRAREVIYQKTDAMNVALVSPVRYEGEGEFMRMRPDGELELDEQLTATHYLALVECEVEDLPEHPLS